MILTLLLLLLSSSLGGGLGGTTSAGGSGGATRANVGQELLDILALESLSEDGSPDGLDFLDLSGTEEGLELVGLYNENSSAGVRLDMRIFPFLKKSSSIIPPLHNGAYAIYCIPIYSPTIARNFKSRARNVR